MAQTARKAIVTAVARVGRRVTARKAIVTVIALVGRRVTARKAIVTVIALVGRRVTARSVPAAGTNGPDGAVGVSALLMTAIGREVTAMRRGVTAIGAPAASAGTEHSAGTERGAQAMGAGTIVVLGPASTGARAATGLAVTGPAVTGLAVTGLVPTGRDATYGREPATAKSGWTCQRASQPTS